MPPDRYQVILLPTAFRELRKIDSREDRKALAEDAEALADDPRPPQSTNIIGERHLYRLRVGNWRVIYEVDDPARQVTVTHVRRRNESTY